MHPVLFRLGPLAVSSYGLLLGLSFILGLWMSYVRAGKAGLNRRFVVDAAFWIVLAAMICARLYYVLVHAGGFHGAPVGRFVPSFGPEGGLKGLSVTGGFIGGVGACLIFFRLKRLPFLPYADAFAPSIGLGIFLTRIGCFLNGCCFGLPTRAWFGVAFPPTCPAGEYQAMVKASRLVPSQLFLSAGGLVILVLTLAAARRRTFPGFAFFVMGISYSALIFLIDFTRVYPAPERAGFLSYTQIVSLILLLLFSGLLFLALHRFRSRERRRRSR